MAGSQTMSVVSVKVFVKQYKVPPMGVSQKMRLRSVAGALPFRIDFKDTHQAAGNLVRNLSQIHFLPASRGKFYLKAIPVKMIVALQSFDQEKVEAETR